MKLLRRRPLFAITVLFSVWLMHVSCGMALAQSDGQDRSARIKEQMGMNSARMASEADLTELRNNLNKALEMIVSRIGALEKDMVDTKSRIRVLEARTAPSGKITGPVSSSADSEPVESEPNKPEPKSRGRASGSLSMNVSMCAAGCDASKLADAIALVAEGALSLSNRAIILTAH